MPQIQVNEIDQSVVTRVVSDDKVKILVPIISSFGPGYDGTLTSINTFTDVTAFNRVYGYTDAEFNPFADDHSRMYATQLIQKGSAVSVVRVNNSGEKATFDIDGALADRTNPGLTTISKPVAASLNPGAMSDIKLTTTTYLREPGKNPSDTPTAWTNYYVIPGTLKLTDVAGNVYTDKASSDTSGTIVNSSGANVPNCTIAYKTGTLSIGSGSILENVIVDIQYNAISKDVDQAKYAAKYTFCPQIDSIEAKYPGSFGNNLAISITQINTTRVAESYQYANISVYYVKKVPVYATDVNGGVIDKSYITGVTLLETKRVSTNPGDAYYFEDVDFDFIKITATGTARDELTLIWSNINASSLASAALYAGFPTVSLKYTDFNKHIVYNIDSALDGGTDFAYSDSVLQKLKLGFMGYYPGASSWSIENVNDYKVNVYGGVDSTGETRPGIVPTIYNSIEGLYGDFVDPYVYDFDFITSGGFVYEEYVLQYNTTKASYSGAYATSISSETLFTNVTSTDILGDAKLAYDRQVVLTITEGTEQTKYYSTVPNPNGNIAVNGNIGTESKYTAAPFTDGADTPTTLSGASINYNTGALILPENASATTVTVEFVYNNESTTAAPIVPVTYGVDTVYYETVNPIHTAMLNLVNTRQDCIALFDVPYNYDVDQIVEYSRILNTSYGTIHNPWCYVQSPTVAGKTVLMAPSYIFLYTFLSNLINNVDSQKWFPPAGVKRATARVVVKPYYEIGSVILNKWQNDNTSRVNPIMKLKQYGYVIYGQYTTLPAIDLYTHSALESLNVRLISNVVKKKIFDVCLNMAFEPNTATLWLKFYSQMDEFLRFMQYNEGVYDYRIVMDESTVTTDDINHLRCPGKVYIAPTRTAEFFDIDFIITEAGAIFTQD